MFFSVFVLVNDKKIWHINCRFACQRIFIRYLYTFAGPLFYIRMLIQHFHEHKLPTASSMRSLSAYVFFCVLWFKLSLGKLWHYAEIFLVFRLLTDCVLIPKVLVETRSLFKICATKLLICA